MACTLLHEPSYEFDLNFEEEREMMFRNVNRAVHLGFLLLSAVSLTISSAAFSNTEFQTANSVTGGGRVDEHVISSCAIDPPFRPAGVSFKYVGDNGYRTVFYYTANYRHGYILKEKVLLTTFDAYGNVVQQMTIDRNNPKTVELTSPNQYSTMQYIEYKRPEATRDMKAQYDNEVSGRLLMQCGEN